jgi:hypothetical protein
MLKDVTFALDASKPHSTSTMPVKWTAKAKQIHKVTLKSQLKKAQKAQQEADSKLPQQALGTNFLQREGLQVEEKVHVAPSPKNRDPFAKAKEKAQQRQQQIEEEIKQQEYDEFHIRQLKEIQKKERSKKTKVYSQRTSRGQPKLGAQVDLLLGKIQKQLKNK